MFINFNKFILLAMVLAYSIPDAHADMIVARLNNGRYVRGTPQYVTEASTFILKLDAYADSGGKIHYNAKPDVPIYLNIPFAHINKSAATRIRNMELPHISNPPFNSVRRGLLDFRIRGTRMNNKMGRDVSAFLNTIEDRLTAVRANAASMYICYLPSPELPSIQQMQHFNFIEARMSPRDAAQYMNKISRAVENLELPIKLLHDAHDAAWRRENPQLARARDAENRAHANMAAAEARAAAAESAALEAELRAWSAEQRANDAEMRARFSDHW